MWLCPTCNEQLEDSFEMCWNCGTSPDGIVSADFSPERDDPSIPDPGPNDNPSTATITPPPLNGSGGMTRHEIATLCCKVVAILMACQSAFFVISGVLLMGTIIMSWPLNGFFPQYRFAQTAILSVPALTLAGMALFCWKKSEAIARRMVGDSPDKVTSMEIASNDVLTIGLTVAGVFIFVDGFRNLIGYLYLASEMQFSFPELIRSPGFLGAVATLILSLWLILGSQGIANAIRYLRTAGRYTPQTEDANEQK